METKLNDQAATYFLNVEEVLNRIFSFGGYNLPSITPTQAIGSIITFTIISDIPDYKIPTLVRAAEFLLTKKFGNSEIRITQMSEFPNTYRLFF